MFNEDIRNMLHFEGIHWGKLGGLIPTFSVYGNKDNSKLLGEIQKYLIDKERIAPEGLGHVVKCTKHIPAWAEDSLAKLRFRYSSDAESLAGALRAQNPGTRYTVGIVE